MHYDRLWSFKTTNFTVVLDCTPELEPDLSWADAETLDNIKRGLWDNVMFRVRILGPSGEELSADYLGNSVYADVCDFRKEHVGARGRHGSYFRDMVSEAVSEARAVVNAYRAIRLRAA